MSPPYLADLRVLRTREMVAKYGGSPHKHRRARSRLGIPSPDPTPGYGRSVQPWHALLGTMSDGDVSLQSGRHRTSVAKARRALGIPAFGEETPAPPIRQPSKAKAPRPKADAAKIAAPKATTSPPKPVSTLRRHLPAPIVETTRPSSIWADEPPPGTLRIEMVTPSNPIECTSDLLTCPCPFCVRDRRGIRRVGTGDVRTWL